MEIKHAIVPGLLAFVGVKIGQMISGNNSGWALVGGAAGGIAGVWAAAHLAGKKAA